MKRRFSIVAALLLTFVSLVASLFIAPPASAAVGYTRLSNGYTSQCLDSNQTYNYRRNFAQVYSRPCVYSYPDQRWTWLSNYQIWNHATEGCLNADTTRAYQNYPCIGVQWSFVNVIGYSGAYLIRSRYNPNYCLAAPSWNGGQPLMVTPCNGGYSDQRWYAIDSG